MAQFAVIRGTNHKIVMFAQARHLLVCALIGLGLHACSQPVPDKPVQTVRQQPTWSPSPGPSAPASTYKVGTPYQIAGTWYYPREDYDYRETGIASWYGPGFHGGVTANGETYNPQDLTAAHRTLPMPSIVQVTNLVNGRSIKVRINDRGPFARSRIIDLSQRAAQLLGFEQQGTAKVLVEIVESESRQLAAAALADEAANTAPRAVPMVAVTAEPLPGSPAPGEAGASGSSKTALAMLGQSDAVPTAVGSVSRNLVEIRPTGANDIYVQAGAFTNFNNANRLRARLSPLGNVRIASVMVDDNQFFRVQLGPVGNVDEADKLLELLLANGHSEARVVID